MVEKTNHNRRRFLATAIMAIASAELGMVGFSAAQTKAKPATMPPIKPGTNKSFGPLKQVDAGVLNIGYAEACPSGGPPARVCNRTEVFYPASRRSGHDMIS